MFNTSLTEQATQSAERAVHRGAEGVRHASQQLRDSAMHASDSSVRFIQREPVKSVLIAAATGAVLMALVARMNRPHMHR